MKDINFFRPYLNKRKVKFNNKFFLLVIFALVTVGVVAYGIFNQMRINKLSEGLKSLEEVAKNPDVLERVKVIKLEEEKLNQFKLEVEAIRDLKREVKKKDIINSNYMEKIISKKPSDLFLTSIYLNPESISISGTSNNRLSIAEFGKGLQTIDGYEKLFISNITKETTNYNFEFERSIVEEEEDETREEETPEESEEE